MKCYRTTGNEPGTLFRRVTFPWKVFSCNGYDDTDPDVHALFDHFKKSKDVFDSFKMERILECIETCRMTEQLIVFFPKLEEFDPKTTELFKKAIYKMPMPYLTGMTLQDYRSKMVIRN